ncbi:MAG: Nramp family divalent metal transporter [Ignavibacteriae bacterium]|nr:Nramp family divalent metal transporter [Ignavibacteriota bacterium]
MSRTQVSLSEVHRSVHIPKGVSIWRRMFAFLGPAYLISVGYMDPGNWATDIEGGARFGYTLLWVLLMSNAMAVLLQTLSARLGIVAGRDLAQACRDNYPRPVTFALWVFTEIAIAATDLAEVLGTAIGLNLLFGIPMIWGVLITGVDTMLFLAIQNMGMRKFEAFILSLVTVIGLCFIFELFLSKPDLAGIAGGFVPRLPDGALYVAIGIIGATVMPHNLYLHSALVQTRSFDASDEGKRQACRFNLIDSSVALNAAFFVNGAILVLAAAAFHRNGMAVTELQQAHHLLSPLLGTTLAGTAFALALLAAGQSSTITGTLAGQIVMEGYLHFKIRPFLRRLFTRLLAIVPAVIVISSSGEGGTYRLLILSQVILSLQLPFAVIPLIHFTSSGRIMGAFANKLWVRLLAWLVAAIVVSLNIKLVAATVSEWISGSGSPILLGSILAPVLGLVAALLLYVTLQPMLPGAVTDRLPGWKSLRHLLLADDETLRFEVPKYRRIGVAVDMSDDDQKVLGHAFSLARHHDARLVLFHVVEGAGGTVFGHEAFDTEAREDAAYLATLAGALAGRGVDADTALGFGNVPKEIVRLARLHEIDVLVMGGHGHRAAADFLLGSTIEPVRHELEIPVVIVR